jgi:Rieske Fe-S protein
MADIPQWKAAFPVRQSQEHAVSRREFCKVACCSALAVGAGWFAKDRFLTAPPGPKPQRVASVANLPVGSYKLFTYPDESQPCILVRLGENEFAAYSQVCTHLMCPVHYRSEQRQFYCPCHEGYFSAEDGRVLAGPPPRPLPRYPVEVRDGQIWVRPNVTYGL